MASRIQVDRAALDAGAVDAAVVDHQRVADPQARTIVAPQEEVPATGGGDLDLARQPDPEVVLPDAGADARDLDAALEVGRTGLVHRADPLEPGVPVLELQSGPRGDRGGRRRAGTRAGEQERRDGRGFVVGQVHRRHPTRDVGRERVLEEACKRFVGPGRGEVVHRDRIGGVGAVARHAADFRPESLAFGDPRGRDLHHRVGRSEGPTLRSEAYEFLDRRCLPASGRLNRSGIRMPSSPPWARTRSRIAAGDRRPPTPSSPRIAGAGATPSRSIVDSSAAWQAVQEASATRVSASKDRHARFETALEPEEGSRSPQPRVARVAAARRASAGRKGSRVGRRVFTRGLRWVPGAICTDRTVRIVPGFVVDIRGRGLR